MKETTYTSWAVTQSPCGVRRVCVCPHAQRWLRPTEVSQEVFVLVTGASRRESSAVYRWEDGGGSSVWKWGASVVSKVLGGSRGKRVFKGRVLLHEAGAEGLTGLLGSSCSPRSPSCPQGGHTASSLCLKLSPSSFLKTEVLWMVTWLIYALKLIKVDTLEVS